MSTPENQKNSIYDDGFARTVVFFAPRVSDADSGAAWTVFDVTTPSGDDLKLLVSDAAAKTLLRRDSEDFLYVGVLAPAEEGGGGYKLAGAVPLEEFAFCDCREPEVMEGGLKSMKATLRTIVNFENHVLGAYDKATLPQFPVAIVMSETQDIPKDFLVKKFRMPTQLGMLPGFFNITGVPPFALERSPLTEDGPGIPRVSAPVPVLV